jgi:hypothetical protein
VLTHILNLLVVIVSKYTDKKEKKIFLIYKEIQSGAVAKSGRRKERGRASLYMRKCAI